MLLDLCQWAINNHRQPCLPSVVLFTGGTPSDAPVCNAYCDCSTDNCKLMLLANPGLKSIGWNVCEVKLISPVPETTTTTMTPTIREATTVTPATTATTTTTTATTTITTTTTPTISTNLSVYNFPFHTSFRKFYWVWVFTSWTNWQYWQ